MILATADSNIYISGFQFGGPPRLFLSYARAGLFKLAISEPLLGEIREVLQRKFVWPQEALAEATAALEDFAILVHPSMVLTAVTDDPDDNRVLECALASRSEFIVTGDNDLLRLREYETVRIVKVAEFLKLIPNPAPQ